MDEKQLRVEALRLAIAVAEYQAAPNTAENIRAAARVFFDFLKGDCETQEGDDG